MVVDAFLPGSPGRSAPPKDCIGSVKEVARFAWAGGTARLPVTVVWLPGQAVENGASSSGPPPIRADNDPHGPWVPERAVLHFRVRNGSDPFAFAGEALEFAGGAAQVSPLGFEGADGVALDAGHLVGQIRLRIVAAGLSEPLLELELRVEPNKLPGTPTDPLHQVNAVYRTVATAHSGLLVEMASAGRLAHASSAAGPDLTPAQELMLIRHLTAETGLLHAVEAIARSPHRRVRTAHPQSPTATARRIDASRLATRLGRPGAVRAPGVLNMGDGVSLDLLTVPERVVHIDVDTPPNRFVVAAVVAVIGRLRVLRQTFRGRPGLGECLGALADRLCRQWESVARRLPDVTATERLDTSNSVLQGDERYRVVLRSWLVLRLGLMPEDGGRKPLPLPLAEMPELYEYLCLVELDLVARALGWTSARLDVGGEAFDTVNHRVRDNTLAWRYTRGTDTLWLDYNRTAPAKSATPQSVNLTSYSVSLRPDFVLKWMSGPTTRIMVLDAKYSVDLRGWRTTSEVDEDFRREERRGIFQRGDLYKMHAYRDALAAPFATVDWVVALFPGTQDAEFVQSEFGGVGAIPVTPDDERAHLTEFLRRWFASPSPGAQCGPVA